MKKIHALAPMLDALAASQAALPVQEPPQYSLKAHWTDDKRIGVVACVTRPDGGVHLLQTIIDPPSEQEPVSMRMPKVGDKVICLEDESLGEVVSLTAGGSPDILFDDGSRGTYLLHEFAELFGYVTSLLPEQEPVAWITPDGEGFRIRFSPPTNDVPLGWDALYTAPPLPVQPEPVTWDKPSASFDEWWDGDRRRDNANPFTTDSFAYWAWEGWQAALAQRPWVGLTNEEIRDCLGPEAVRIPPGWSMLTRAIEAKLKEKNHG